MLLSFAGVGLLGLIATKVNVYQQKNVFGNNDGFEYVLVLFGVNMAVHSHFFFCRYMLLMLSTMFVATSYSVAIIVAVTGSCKSTDHQKVSHIETFAWINLSFLIINLFLSTSANLSPMTSENSMRDMIQWSSLGSVNLFRFIVFVTLVYVLRDSVLFNGSHDNNEININDSYGGLMSPACMLAAQRRPPREVLDKFELISLIGGVDEHNGVVLKVTSNEHMVGAVYSGLVFTILSSLSIMLALQFRKDFSTYTINLPGITEKVSQVIADVIIAIVISSLILENELAACQPWKLTTTSIQCLFVSVSILMYNYIVQIFIQSARRFQMYLDKPPSFSAFQNADLKNFLWF